MIGLMDQTTSRLRTPPLEDRVRHDAARVDRPPVDCSSSRVAGWLLNATEAHGAEVVSEEQAGDLAADLVDDSEIIILVMRPSVLYIPLSCLQSLAVIALLTLLGAYLEKWPWSLWMDTQVFALGIAAAGVCLFWQALEWYNRLYVLTDRRVVRRSGVLRITVFHTPLREVQHTSVFRRLRERLFGLGTIGFAKAGSEVFDETWVMVPQPLAVHRIVQETLRRYRR